MTKQTDLKRDKQANLQIGSPKPSNNLSPREEQIIDSFLDAILDRMYADNKNGRLKFQPKNA